MDAAVDPEFRASIVRFGSLTGMPVLPNTSFHLRGDRTMIVATADAATARSITPTVSAKVGSPTVPAGRSDGDR